MENEGIRLVEITAEEVLRYGWETEDGVAFVLMLDDRRHIDLFCVDGEWAFQLIEEPTFDNEQPAIFTGRVVFWMHELFDLYFGLTGMRLG